MARGIPDCQRYVALLARVSDQLEQVVALYELPAEREAYRRRPVVTRHHVGARRHRAGGLDYPLQFARLPDQTAPRPVVIADAVSADVVPGGVGGDVKPDPVTHAGRRQAGEAVYRRTICLPGKVPGRRAWLLVLGYHPVRFDPVRPGERGRAGRCRLGRRIGRGLGSASRRLTGHGG